MALTLNNHTSNVMGKEPVRFDEVAPGDVVQFRYKGENTRDPKPMVFVLFEKELSPLQP